MRCGHPGRGLQGLPSTRSASRSSSRSRKAIRAASETSSYTYERTRAQESLPARARRRSRKPFARGPHDPGPVLQDRGSSSSISRRSWRAWARATWAGSVRTLDEYGRLAYELAAWLGTPSLPPDDPGAAALSLLLSSSSHRHSPHSRRVLRRAPGRMRTFTTRSPRGFTPSAG